MKKFYLLLLLLSILIGSLCNGMAYAEDLEVEEKGLRTKDIVLKNEHIYFSGNYGYVFLETVEHKDTLVKMKPILFTTAIYPGIPITITGYPGTVKTLDGKEHYGIKVILIGPSSGSIHSLEYIKITVLSSYFTFANIDSYKPFTFFSSKLDIFDYNAEFDNDEFNNKVEINMQIEE